MFKIEILTCLIDFEMILDDLHYFRCRIFVIITIDIFDFAIYVSQRLIRELTKTSKFV